ncbi:hypothetical protein [Sphingomonas pokkalii]|uniref:Uncharacterized protein n=1 Tax=Sphingomonas pokkalii TaxID=2175090 RepID=A0A2U0SH81_9SPHN|nr:hypothetical protein [Sphingomonas pokkalii]PVX30713.1 hypothetical protein DD559_16345 [Sphingomonas pokkalii]
MTDTSKMRRDARGKRPGFYDTPGMDQVMSMVMVLASEVSVLADDIDLMQRVAAGQGIDLKAGMAAIELDQAALEEREARRQALLDRLFYLMRKEAHELAAQETSDSYIRTIDEIALG